MHPSNAGNRGWCSCRGRPVSVSRGIGWEFEKYIDGLAETMRWHRGRCLSYGEGLVFWALAEIIRQRLGIAEEDPPEVAAVKLTSGLERYVPDVDDRAFIGTRHRTPARACPSRVTRARHCRREEHVRRLASVLRAPWRRPIRW